LNSPEDGGERPKATAILDLYDGMKRTVSEATRSQYAITEGDRL
jgi:hypothetical protein